MLTSTEAFLPLSLRWLPNTELLCDSVLHFLSTNSIVSRSDVRVSCMPRTRTLCHLYPRAGLPSLNRISLDLEFQRTLLLLRSSSIPIARFAEAHIWSVSPEGSAQWPPPQPRYDLVLTVLDGAEVGADSLHRLLPPSATAKDPLVG